MSNNTTIKEIAQLLYDNNIKISSYDYEIALLLLLKLGASDDTINLFKKESFHVFVEIMRIETVDSMQNMFKPI
jgi:hypothetical protein